MNKRQTFSLIFITFASAIRYYFAAKTIFQRSYCLFRNHMLIATMMHSHCLIILMNSHYCLQNHFNHTNQNFHISIAFYCRKGSYYMVCATELNWNQNRIFPRNSLFDCKNVQRVTHTQCSYKIYIFSVSWNTSWILSLPVYFFPIK